MDGAERCADEGERDAKKGQGFFQSMVMFGRARFLLLLLLLLLLRLSSLPNQLTFQTTTTVTSLRLQINYR